MAPANSSDRIVATGGHVIDPAQAIDRIADVLIEDVLIEDGRITRVGSRLLGRRAVDE